jgi:hypothetical protein
VRKIVNLALAAGAALAVIAPALADPQLSAECLKMDSLRATAKDTKSLADLFEARARDEKGGRRREVLRQIRCRKDHNAVMAQ